MAKIVQDVEPTSFEDVVGDVKWNKAMNEEMDALDMNNKWDLALLQEGMNVIGCKWVYKVKYNLNGTLSRYKAILVEKGYAHTYDIDYEETFNPITKMSTFHTIAALNTIKGWVLH